MKPALTILTAPPPRNFGRKLRRIRKGRDIGGHYAVTRSVLAGLDALGVRYNYNPAFEFLLAPKVWVVAGVETLRYAIELKRKGGIRFLAAGPNISVLPSWDDNLLAAPEVDICIVPSAWARREYEEDCPSLRGRIREWACGVDPAQWPLPATKVSGGRNPSALIYLKSPDAPLDVVTSALDSFGVNCESIRYGEYTPQEYHQALCKADFAVFLSRSESQGIALAEAWLLDVPTLVWDPGNTEYNGHVFRNASAAPYLSSQTGRTWKSPEELRAALEHFLAGKHTYAPRAWVLAYMTDAVTARKLTELLSL